jgi:hypothetical protein
MAMPKSERGLPGVTVAVVTTRKLAANYAGFCPSQSRRQHENTGENRGSGESRTSGERT